MRGIWRVVVLLAVIWGIAAIVIFTSRAMRPTPASLTAYIDKHPLTAETPASERTTIITRVGDQLNRLTFDERQQLQAQKTMPHFFRQLTPAEQNAFLKQTLPDSFKQIMLALNKMEPGKRKKIIQRAVDDMEKNGPVGDKRISDAQEQQIISQGLESFYEDASAEVKLDCAPIIEQLQRQTQNIR